MFIFKHKQPYMKICSICKKDKNQDEFPFQNKEQNKLMSACKECKSKISKKKRVENSEQIKEKDRKRYEVQKEKRVEYARNYRKKNPDKTRRTHLKTKYGITPEIYEEKLIEQDHKCAICRRDKSSYKRVFSIDHSHITGEIRGLLCDPCNYGLGFYEKYKDNYEKYLLKFKK